MFVNPLTTLVKIVVSFAFFILGQIFVGASINTIFDYIPRIDRLFAPNPKTTSPLHWRIGDGNRDDFNLDPSADGVQTDADVQSGKIVSVAKTKAKKDEEQLTRDRIINVNAATSLWAAMADKID